MEKKYNRVANIDEQIKNVSLPFFHWKVLFLVLEETNIQELVEILKSNEDDITQALEGLENKKLIEVVQREAKPEIKTLEADEEIIVDEQEESVFEEEVEKEKVAEPEIEEIAEKPEDADLEILESIQETEKEETGAEESTEDSFLMEVDGDLSSTSVDEKEEVVEESIEPAEVSESEAALPEIKDTEKEKVDEDDESSDITSFIEELGEPESESGKDQPKEIEEEPESEPDEGPEKAPEIVEEKSESAKDAKTVMVVDDSIVIRKMVEIALEDDDYNIITSNSGKEGLKLLDDESPHLVILDMTLPDMSGIDLLKTIKASKGIPVIMLSGKDAPQLVENAKNAGADDFLPKPFRDEDLVEKVKSLVK